MQAASATPTYTKRSDTWQDHSPESSATSRSARSLPWLPTSSNSTKSMVDSIQGLRPDGRLVTMGADAEPLSVSLMDLISKRIRIIGSQQNGPEYINEALDLVAQGKVKTIIATYSLEEAHRAFTI